MLAGRFCATNDSTRRTFLESETPNRKSKNDLSLGNFTNPSSKIFPLNRKLRVIPIQRSEPSIGNRSARPRLWRNSPEPLKKKRQREDPELDRWTSEIRLRAITEIGKLSRELEKSKGGANPKATLATDGKSKHEQLAEAGAAHVACLRQRFGSAGRHQKDLRPDGLPIKKGEFTEWPFPIGTRTKKGQAPSARWR